jgi:CheY-like chemotaxis protein
MEASYPLVIVEDDDDDLYIVQSALNDVGCSGLSHGVRSGHQLFSYLDSIREPANYPSIILLDYNLPILTGEEIFIWMKKNPAYRDMTYIAYSSGMSPLMRQRLLSLGMDYCFEKPNTSSGIKTFAESLKAILEDKIKVI